jgi:hypothetical protein
MCLGWRYAMFVIKVQLAHFLLSYECDTKLKFDELKFVFGFSTHVSQGYKVSIRPRA